MASVVFLRAVNVGGANVCRPALLAKQLARFDVVNIGAVGTFVVRKHVSASMLREAIARKLPFKSEIMICPAKEIVDLVKAEPFARSPAGADITWFASMAAKPIRRAPRLPVAWPADEKWLLKITAIRGRFVLGIYQRQMKAVAYLGKIEKWLGVPLTTRNWNTIEKVAATIAR